MLRKQIEDIKSEDTKERFQKRLAKLAGGEVLDAHVPTGGGFGEVDDAMVGGDAAALLAGEPAEEFAGKTAEIHVGAAVHFGRGDGTFGAALGEEGCP